MMATAATSDVVQNALKIAEHDDEVGEVSTSSLSNSSQLSMAVFVEPLYVQIFAKQNMFFVIVHCNTYVLLHI